MKKFFTFVALMGAAIAVNATIVELKPSQFTAVDQAAVNQTVNEVSLAITKGTITSDQFRIFQHQTITISAEKEISAVVLNCTASGEAKYGPGNFDPLTGYTYSGKVGTWIGTSNSVALKAEKAQVRVSSILVYFDGETPEVDTWVADTITVADALKLIADNDPLMAKSHYITGIVTERPFNTFKTFDEGRASFFFSSHPEKTDSLEAYQIFAGKGNKKWVSLDAVRDSIHIGDTVRVYADALTLYKNASTGVEIPEITTGYFDKMLGKNPNPPVFVPDTLTVAQAIEYGMSLDSMATSQNEYVIKGYALNPGAFSLLYRNQGWNMADDAANSLKQEFKAFNCSPLLGEDTVKVLAGDSLLLFGKLKKFYDKDSKKFIIEVEQGVAQIVAPVEGERAVDLVPVEVSVAQALEIGSTLASGATSPKLYIITGYTSAIETPFDKQYKNETFWIADDPTSEANTNADGAFYIYRGKPSNEKELGVHAKIRVKTDIKNYKGTIENNEANIPVEVLEEGQPFVPDTITVAEAVELAKDLAPTTGSSPCTKYVVVKGFAVKLFSNKNGNHWYMSDDPTDEKGDLEAYAPTVDKEVAQGDYMYLAGCIIKYGSKEPYTFEISKGVAKHGVAPVVEIKEVSVAEALAIGADLEIDEKTPDTYRVIGYVARILRGYDETGTMTVLLSDDEKASTGTFRAEDMKIDEAVVEHEQIEVVGKIMKQEGSSNPLVGIWDGTAKKYSAQSVEEIVLTEKAQKVLVDGVLYIVRDNKLFDVRGTRVR